MEVEIAALYKTMHITLQWTDRPRVWSWGYGFKYGYWLICTLFCYCLQFQDIHVFCFLLLYVLPFSFQSSSPNRAGLRKQRKNITRPNITTNILSNITRNIKFLSSWILTLIIAICRVILKLKLKRDEAILSPWTHNRHLSWEIKILHHLRLLRLVDHLHLPCCASSVIFIQSYIMHTVHY